MMSTEELRDVLRKQGALMADECSVFGRCPNCDNTLIQIESPKPIVTYVCISSVKGIADIEGKGCGGMFIGNAGGMTDTLVRTYNKSLTGAGA